MADEPIDDDISPDDEEPEVAPSRPGRAAGKSKQQPPERLLWPDREFRRRVQRRARQLGKPVAEVMRRAGVGEDYVYRSAFWRDTNAIMCIAEDLEMTPTELCDWPAPQPAAAQAKAPPFDPELHRTSTFVRLFTEQTLAMLYVVLAMNRQDADPAAVAAALGLDNTVAAALAAAVKKS